MKSLKLKQNIIVGCDFSLNTGEGVLANDYIRMYQNIKKQKTYKKIFLNFLNKKGFIHKYFVPLIICIYIKINFNKKFIYVNYLPLWNFLIFLILPKHTILGPITGSLIQRDNNNPGKFIRKNFFPFFYKISLYIIQKKFKKIIFSTDLLKEKFNMIKSQFLSNYVINSFRFKKTNSKSKKKYDLIFYYREHENKNNQQLNKIIQNLANYKIICVVGDKFETKSSNIINFGYISRNNVHKLMRKTKFAICGPENLYSLYAIDAYNNQCRLLVDKKLRKYQIANSENFNFIDFKFSKKNVTKILNIFKKEIFKKDLKFKKKIQIKKKEIKKFFINI